MRTVYPATLTLSAIEDALQKDQGASYRKHLRQVLPHIEDAYREEDSALRGHLGGSVVGGECARAIWYGYRWYSTKRFDGRILRLFNRGHLEEGRFLALLLMIGCEVYQQDADGRQFRISHADGHFGGSTDGVAIGLPDLPPGTAALLEFKTHNDKSFTTLEDQGVRASKLEHFVQMQVYMRKLGLSVALYMAVNKNTDALYAEIVMLDTAVADQFLDRGAQIIALDAPPKKLNESAAFYKCKWCDFRPHCHSNAKPLVNCRTCKQSRPSEDGLWYCARHDKGLDRDAQVAGCGRWERRPN